MTNTFPLVYSSNHRLLLNTKIHRYIIHIGLNSINQLKFYMNENKKKSEKSTSSHEKSSDHLQGPKCDIL